MGSDIKVIMIFGKQLQHGFADNEYIMKNKYAIIFNIWWKNGGDKLFIIYEIFLFIRDFS
jgi:hypothetical protein